MLKAAQDMSSTAGAQLVTELQQIVGHHHVLTEDGATLPYRRGFRFGEDARLRWSCPVRWWNSGACCRPA